MTVEIRPVAPSGRARHIDRSMLEQFTCTTKDGPIYERAVQRIIRRDAQAYEGRRRHSHDHRLLLVFDDGELMAVGSHERTDVTVGAQTEQARLLVVSGASLSVRGRPGEPGVLSDGRRVSDVLFDARIGDMYDRDDPPRPYVIARVDPANAPCQKFLRRRGLVPLPGARAAGGLVVYGAPLA